MADLLSDIAAFCERHGMAETKFGLLALNDKAFVSNIRGSNEKKPRRIWPETADRVRAFMDNHDAELAKAS